MPPNTFLPDPALLLLPDDADDLPCEGCGVLQPQPVSRLPGTLSIDSGIVMIGIPDQDGDPGRK